MARTFALVGNPNCGKTTLFNALTGSNQYVGNWPGVTVEKKTGTCKLPKETLTIVDLPGIYSLSPHSLEEVIARNYIIEESPDAVINIVDGTNLARNLYLTLQLLELGKPTILAINMMDEVRKNGDSIDYAGLSKALGIPVLPISANRGEGLDALKQALLTTDAARITAPADLYERDMGESIANLERLLSSARGLSDTVSKRWYAVKMLENDELVLQLPAASSLKSEIEKLSRAIAATPEDCESAFAEARYGYIDRLAKKLFKKTRAAHKLTTSDKIDRVLTHRILALPIFLLIMYLMFEAAFGTVGAFLTDTLDVFINETLYGWVEGLLAAANSADWFRSLILDGILAGVGGVLVFVPIIGVLFIFMTLLEDSGYMARAAFIMDRMLRRLGLSGKSFIPMLMGFGCSVPAIMAARTLENEKDRKMTIMLAPFMSCGARAPIYALFVGAFFANNQGFVTFTIYMLGIVIAIVSGLLLKRTLFKGDPAPFVMELPPYRLPTFLGLCKHVWDKLKGFVVRAGTIIFAISIVIWFLQSFNGAFQMVEDASTSILASIGGFIAPIFAPLGFGNWQAGVSLLTGFAAKEAVVSTMEIVYGAASPEQMNTILQSLFTPLTSYAFMAFTLLYLPCGAAFATIRREMGSWRWTLITVGYQTGVAWVVAFLIYNVGRLFGL